MDTPVPDPHATKRLRVLRAGAYRCGVRSQAGVLCGAPASQVDDAYRYPVCADHAAQG